jgi:hypothetical protein
VSSDGSLRGKLVNAIADLLPEPGTTRDLGYSAIFNAACGLISESVVYFPSWNFRLIGLRYLFTNAT